ncbi:CBS domain-containing protein [Geodermatophilus sp. SYSU D00708]
MAVPPSPAPTSTGPLVAAQVMRPPVTTVERSAHVAAVAYLMKKSHDNALVVISDDGERRPITVICDSDVTQAVADGRDLEETRITDLHLGEVVTFTSDTPVPQVAERMLETRVAYAPVVEEGRLVGLVDLAVVCGALLTDRRSHGLRDDEA